MYQRLFKVISIHAPRVGRDSYHTKKGVSILFQSTRPVWGATCENDVFRLSRIISIHAPRVGRDKHKWERTFPHAISIHAPRVGRDGSR